jgi:hypothetical protein
MITAQQQRKIEAVLEDRLRGLHGLRIASKAAQKLETEFIVGAMTAINTLRPNKNPDKISKAVPVSWIVDLMAGDRILK